jgi:hypothetical protein
MKFYAHKSGKLSQIFLKKAPKCTKENSFILSGSDTPGPHLAGSLGKEEMWRGKNGGRMALGERGDWVR